MDEEDQQLYAEPQTDVEEPQFHELLARANETFKISPEDPAATPTKFQDHIRSRSGSFKGIPHIPETYVDEDEDEYIRHNRSRRTPSFSLDHPIDGKAILKSGWQEYSQQEGNGDSTEEDDEKVLERQDSSYTIDTEVAESRSELIDLAGDAIFIQKNYASGGFFLILYCLTSVLLFSVWCTKNGVSLWLYVFIFYPFQLFFGILKTILPIDFLPGVQP